MPLFSRRSESQEASYSQAWLAKTGGRTRKVELAVATIALLTHTVGDAAAWGRPLDGDLTTAGSTLDGAVWQDRSLARHVARDLALFFEANGGLALNQEAALAAVGLSSATTLDGTSGSTPERVAGQALAVARVIQVRSQGGGAGPADLTVYQALYQDRTSEGYERAIDIGAWSAIVVARLATGNRLDSPGVFLQPGADSITQMEGVGWYPNPVNAGVTSQGDASIERWWDGNDWTDRVRVREGRRWNATQLSLLTTPNN